MGGRCNGLILECCEEVYGVKKHETCALGFRRLDRHSTLCSVTGALGQPHQASVPEGELVHTFLFFPWNSMMSLVHHAQKMKKKMAEGKYSCRSTCAGEFLSPVLL